MKRLIPDTLITFLQTHRNVIKADCFAIALPTGAMLYATEGQWDITFRTDTPGWTGAQTTFRAAQYGVWNRGAITSEAGSGCKANTMSLTCVPQPGTAYPGLSIGITNAALNRLFDGAQVWVYTAYMAVGQYGDVSAGIETKWQGTITRIPGLARNKIEFECADPLYLLNLKIPSRVLQSGCPWEFTDSNCTLTPADYTADFTAAVGSTQDNLIPYAALLQPDGYFTQGVVTCLTGANAGLSQTVKIHADGNITTMLAWLLPIRPGDTFAAVKGCDKTMAMCRATAKTDGTVVNNLVHFGGTPFVPPPSNAV